MRRVIYLFLLFFNLNALTTSAQESDSLLRWDKSYVLRSNDFRAEPDTNSSFSAITYAGITCFSDFDSGTTTKFKTSCIFHRNMSWIKNKSDSSYLLLHEQGHFNIAEIYRRKLQMRLKALEHLNYSQNELQIEQEMDRLFNDTMVERSSFDSLYDIETNFSRNESQQIIWIKKIKDLLEATN